MSITSNNKSNDSNSVSISIRILIWNGANHRFLFSFFSSNEVYGFFLTVIAALSYSPGPSQSYRCNSRGFHKYTTLAIMPILASEALLRNKEAIWLYAELFLGHHDGSCHGLWWFVVIHVMLCAGFCHGSWWFMSWFVVICSDLWWFMSSFVVVRVMVCSGLW